MSSNTTSMLSSDQYQSNSYSQQSSTEKEWYWPIPNPHWDMKPCANLRHVGRRKLDKIDLYVDRKESVSFAKKHTLSLVGNWRRLHSQLGNKAIRDAQKVPQHAFGCPSKVIRDPTIISAIVTKHHACSCVMPGCPEVGKHSAYKDRRIPNVDSDSDGCVRFNGKNNLLRSFSSKAAREVREINKPLTVPQVFERSCTIRGKRLILPKYPNKYCHLRSVQSKFSPPAQAQSGEVPYESLCLSNPCPTTEQTLSQPNEPVLQFKQKIEQLTAKSDRDHPNITHTNNTNHNSNKHFLSSATSLNEMESRSPAQVKSFFTDHLLLPKVEPIDYGDDDEQRPIDHYNGDGNNQAPFTIFDEDPKSMMPKQPTRIQKNIPNDGIMIPKYSLVVSFSSNQQQVVNNVPTSSMNSHDDMNTIDHQSNNQSNDNNNHNSNNQNVDPHHNNHGESGGSNSNDNRDNRDNNNNSNSSNNNSNDDKGKANDQNNNNNNNSSNNDGKDEGNNDEEEGDDRAGEDEEDDAISGGAEDDDSAGSDHNHQSDGVSGGSSSSNSKKRKRKRFNEACTECRRAHKACSRTRPCERCVRLGTPEKCQSMERKKRKVTKKRWFNYQVQENGKITLENTKQQQQQQQQRQKAMQSSFASSSMSNESASSSVSNIVHGSTMNTTMNSSSGVSQSFSPPVYQTPSATTAHQQQYQQSRTIVTNQPHGVNYQNQQQQQYHPSFSMQHQEQQQAPQFHQHHPRPSPYMATTGSTSGLSQRATDIHTQQQQQQPQQQLHYYYHHPPHQKQNNNSSNNQQFQQHQNKNIHGIMSTANTNTSTPSIMNQQHLGGSTGSQMSGNSNHLLVPSTTHHQISHTTAAIDSKQPDMMIPRSASSSSLFEPSLLHQQQQQHLPYHQHSQQVQQSIDGSQMALPSFNRLSNQPASGVGGSSMGRMPGHNNNNNHSAVVSSSSWHPNSSPSYDVLASPSPHQQQQEQRSDHALVVMDHRLRQQQHHTGHLMNMSMTPSPSSFVHQHTQQTHQFHSYQPSNVSGLITGANSSGRGGVNTASIFHGATFGEEVSGFESVNPSSSTSTSSLHPSTTSSEAHSQQ